MQARDGRPVTEEKTMQVLLDRMLRAAKLEVGLYEEVEADTGVPWGKL